MNSLHKSSGSTLPEVLIAAGIIMVVALGISGAFAFYKMFDARNRMESTQLMLESQILLAIQTSSNYSVTDIGNLKVGAVPTGLTLQNTAGVTIAVVGTPQYFDSLGNPTTLGSGSDALMTELSVQCLTTPYINCYAAYRISQNPTFSKPVENLVPVGSYGPLWQASDYMAIIPHGYYMGYGVATSCAPASYVGAYGFDPTTLGITCISKPTAACPGAGGFAIGYAMTAIATPPAYSLMNLDCRTFKALNCPAGAGAAGTVTYGGGYVLESFNTVGLDPRIGTPTGTCVLEGQDTIGWETSTGAARQLGPASTIAQTAVCPMHYVTSYNPCSLTNIVSASAHCSASGATLLPIAGTCTVTMVGNQVKAQVNIPAQPTCPPPGNEKPVWFADTVVTGSCTIPLAVRTEPAVGM